MSAQVMDMLPDDVIELMQVPHALTVLRMHARVHKNRLDGRMVYVYGQGGLRSAKEQTERHVDLATV